MDGEMPEVSLSVMQPWSWLIVAGHKDIENRTWPTRFRGSVLIHAGRKHDGDPDFWEFDDIEPPERFDMGGIVGVAEIVDCVTHSASHWFVGPFGFVIRNARPLPFRPCKGALGFFRPDFTPPTPKPIRPPRQGVLL